MLSFLAYFHRVVNPVRSTFAVCSVALVVLLGASQSCRASSANSVPDWVRDAARQPIPTYPPSTRSVVLLWDTRYVVAPDGKATEHVRYVVKILRPQGRDEAVPFVAYNKDSKVASFHAWSIDPEGHEYAVKDDDVRDYGAEASFELYSDERMKTAMPPGMDVGGVVAWEYEQSLRPYINETSWLFQGDTPRLHQVFTIALPQGFHYKTTWAHHAGIAGADLENGSTRWEMNAEPAIDLEHIPFSPSGEALAARMTVHYTGSGQDVSEAATWKGIGEWYEALARDRMTGSPEIDAKAKSLAAGQTDFFLKARAIGEYVQRNVRYVAIEIGIGGEQPHPAADIFRSSYGDCKDKATLLSAMLSAVGIHSTLVLVDSHRGVIDPDDPSSMGNHAIAAIEIPKGYESAAMHSVVTTASGRRYLLFDPTWDETPFGQLEKNLQDGYAMLVEGPQSDVIHMPVMPPELNRVQRSASFTLLADGTLKGAVTEKRFGDLAERRRRLATAEDAREQNEAINNTLANDLNAASMTDLHFVSASDLGADMVTSFDLEAQHFASLTGPLMMLRPRVFGSYGLPINRHARKVPIDLRETMQGHDEFSIAIPAGYEVDELPAPVKLDLGFAEYESRTTMHGQTLSYTRTFTLRQVTLPASRYHDLQTLAAAIGADEDNQVILKRVAAAHSSVATQACVAH